MEAYDGMFELTLILNDVEFENPMIWNFGKMDIKFKKPMDPTNTTPSYANKNKDKMEPFFYPEQSPTKFIIVSIIIFNSYYKI